VRLLGHPLWPCRCLVGFQLLKLYSQCPAYCMQLLYTGRGYAPRVAATSGWHCPNTFGSTYRN
jgi:hypothetical protein